MKGKHTKHWTVRYDAGEPTQRLLRDDNGNIARFYTIEALISFLQEDKAEMDCVKDEHQ